MLLLQLGEQRDHAAEEYDRGLEAADAQKQIQRVVEGVHGEVLAVEILRCTASPNSTTKRLQARSM